MSVGDESMAAALDRAKVYLGPFLADEGLSGQLLGKQAGAVYDAAVAAIAALERLSQPSDGVTEDEVERVARAIERAQCRGREGPYGGYDYGHNTDFYGPAPEGGRYVIRDFRDSSSPDYGKWVHQTNDHEKHEAAFKQLTEHHIARAAIAALDHITGEKREEPSDQWQPSSKGSNSDGNERHAQRNPAPDASPSPTTTGTQYCGTIAPTDR